MDAEAQRKPLDGRKRDTRNPASLAQPIYRVKDHAAGKSSERQGFPTSDRLATI